MVYIINPSGGGAVDSVNGFTGPVVLTSSDVDAPSTTEFDTLSGTLNSALSDIEDFKPAQTWYVDGLNGDDASTTASFERPARSVGRALTLLGDLPNQIIQVMAMSGTIAPEYLTITQSDLSILGIGTLFSYAFTWQAHLTLSGATRFQMKDMHVHGTDSGIPCITDVTTTGNHNFDNVTISHGFNDQLGYYSYNQTGNGGASFYNCDMFDVNTIIDQSNGSYTYNFTDCVNKGVTVHSGNFCFYRESRTAGPFVHSGGGLIIVGVQTVRTEDGNGGSACITSTSDNNGIISMGNLSLIQLNGQYGFINISGGSLFALSQCGRDPSQDILNGFRFFPGGCMDIDGSYTPINYTPDPDNFLPGHLKGIDVAISGRMLNNPQQQTNQHEMWVAPWGDDSNIGSFDKPYLTIQAAVDAYSGFCVIHLHTGDHYGNISANNKDFILVLGQSVGDLPRTNIHGKVHITGNSTGISFRDIGISLDEGIADPVVLIDSTNGSHAFEHVQIQRIGDAALSGIGGVQLENVTNSTVTFRDCVINGTFDVYNTFSGGTLDMSESQVAGNNDGSAPAITLSGESVYLLENMYPTGNISHHAGLLVIKGGLTIGPDNTGVSIHSDADNSSPVNGLLMFDCNLFYGAGFGKINKTGSSQYAISNVFRDPTQDVLSGTRSAIGGHDSDVICDYTPVNYTSEVTYVKNNIEGIDAALGARAKLVVTPTGSLAPGEAGNYAVASGFAYFYDPTSTSWIQIAGLPF